MFLVSFLILSFLDLRRSSGPGTPSPAFHFFLLPRYHPAIVMQTVNYSNGAAMLSRLFLNPPHRPEPPSLIFFHSLKVTSPPAQDYRPSPVIIFSFPIRLTRLYPSPAALNRAVGRFAPQTGVRPPHPLFEFGTHDRKPPPSSFFPPRQVLSYLPLPPYSKRTTSSLGLPPHSRSLLGHTPYDDFMSQFFGPTTTEQFFISTTLPPLGR